VCTEFVSDLFRELIDFCREIEVEFYVPYHLSVMYDESYDCKRITAHGVVPDDCPRPTASWCTKNKTSAISTDYPAGINQVQNSAQIR